MSAYEGSIRDLINNVITVDQFIVCFKDDDHFNSFFQNMKISEYSVSCLCVCCCEAMLGRSHLICSAILFLLKCLGKVDFYILGEEEHEIAKIYNAFKDTSLRNEPLFINRERDQVSPDFIKYVDETIEELRAAEQILKLCEKNKKLHPCKLYWHLIHSMVEKKIKIDIDKAHYLHSSNGILALTLLYLIQYYEKGHKIEIKTEKILKNFHQIKDEIPERVPMLPNDSGMRLEIDEFLKIVKSFFGIYTENIESESKHEQLKRLANMEEFSFHMFRILNEYQNPKTIRAMKEFSSIMNEHLLTTLSLIKKNPKMKTRANNYYSNWEKSCKNIESTRFISLPSMSLT